MDEAIDVSRIISHEWSDLTALPGYASILRHRGVDLCNDGSFPPTPGTPVYVNGDDSAAEVLRRMSEADVQLVFVLRGHMIVGVVERSCF